MRGARWAYGLFVGMALLYFPQKGGFAFEAPACSWALRGDLITTSATNYSHIILFALFFLITYVHFTRGRVGEWSPLVLAIVITLVMSALVEVAQGASNTGNCELRDLVPDGIGILVAMAVIALWNQGHRVRARRGTSNAV